MKSYNHEYWFGLQVIIVCFLWYTSSSVQSITNKYTLKIYPYPLTVALSSILNNVIYAVPLIRILHITPVRVTSKYVLQTIVPISLGRAMAVACGYFGLWKMSATLPVFTVLISRFMINEKQSKLIYLSLTPIIMGVFIATATELEFDVYGLISSLFSTFAFAYLNVLAKKVFKETGMHPIFLLNLNSQMAAVFLFPAWLVYDGYSMWTKLVENSSFLPDIHFLLCLLVSGACSFVQNLCAFALIHQLTTLSYAVSNAAKRIFVILLSLMALKNPVTAANVFGMMLSIIGVFIYNRTKTMENNKKNYLEDLSLKTNEFTDTNSNTTLLRRHAEEKGPLSNIKNLHNSNSDVSLSLLVQ